MTDWATMSDKEFDQIEKQANKEFRTFKKNFKKKFPHLYAAVVDHEKQGDEKDALFCDIFCSKFRSEVEE